MQGPLPTEDQIQNEVSFRRNIVIESKSFKENNNKIKTSQKEKWNNILSYMN